MDRVRKMWVHQKSALDSARSSRSRGSRSGRRWAWSWSQAGENTVQGASVSVGSIVSSKSWCSDDEHFETCKERVIKVVVMGDRGCGKSSIVDKYCLGIYNMRYVPTIGPELSSCHLPPRLEEGKLFRHPIRVQFVELPAQELSKSEKHLADADGAIVVGDTNNPKCFPLVDICVEKVRTHSRPDCPIVLMLHKTDMPQKVSLRSTGGEQAYAREAGLVAASFTNILSTPSIEGPIDKLLSRILGDAATTSGGCVFPDSVGRAAGGRHEGEGPYTLAKVNSRFVPKAVEVDTGRIDEEKIRTIERQLTAFLNVHSQILGDFKKPFAVRSAAAAPHNAMRMELATQLEHDLHREHDRVMARLHRIATIVKQKQPSSSGALRTYPADLEQQRLELLHVSSYFYTYLVPTWTRITNNMQVEALLAQARGMAKVKAGVVLNPSTAIVQGSSVVPPPPVYSAFVRGKVDRQVPETMSGHLSSRRESAGGIDRGAGSSVSSDATFGLMGTSAESLGGAQGMLSPSVDTWEGHGVSGGSASTRPLSLAMERVVVTPDNPSPTSSPHDSLAQSPTMGRYPADREFLKVLSVRPEYRYLRDTLCRTHQGKERSHRPQMKSPVLNPSSGGAGSRGLHSRAKTRTEDAAPVPPDSTRSMGTVGD